MLSSVTLVAATTDLNCPFHNNSKLKTQCLQTYYFPEEHFRDNIAL